MSAIHVGSETFRREKVLETVMFQAQGSFETLGSKLVMELRRSSLTSLLTFGKF